MLTEEKAKAKWCPFARVDSMALNRPNPGNNCDVTAGWPPCIASDCSAWRWVMISQSARGAIIGGNGELEWDGRPPIGYCGLAGSAVGYRR